MVQRPDAQRFEVIAELVADADSVLDIGCRDRALQRHLNGCSRYVGFDLEPPADIIGSAEERLPFDDGEFACVVLADVLEHLDDPHSALGEAMRVGKAVVVALPNIYTLLHRLRFAFLGTLGGKYAFGPEPRVDRHRWVLGYSEARAFTRGRAEASGFAVAAERPFPYPFNRRSVRAVHAVARVLTSADLWAWSYLARLERPTTHPHGVAQTF